MYSVLMYYSSHYISIMTQIVPYRYFTVLPYILYLYCTVILISINPVMFRRDIHPTIHTLYSNPCLDHLSTLLLVSNTQFLQCFSTSLLVPFINHLLSIKLWLLSKQSSYHLSPVTPLDSVLRRKYSNHPVVRPSYPRSEPISQRMFL
jgi:hypothetical protein